MRSIRTTIAVGDEPARNPRIRINRSHSRCGDAATRLFRVMPRKPRSTKASWKIGSKLVGPVLHSCSGLGRTPAKVSANSQRIPRTTTHFRPKCGHIRRDRANVLRTCLHVRRDRAHIPKDHARIRRDRVNIRRDRPHLRRDRLNIWRTCPRIRASPGALPAAFGRR